nr:amino acid--tRNA ligase-related protein [Paenibacillus hemerocallicola]
MCCRSDTRTCTRLPDSSRLGRRFRDYLSARGFTQIFTPKIVASGTEGGSHLFPVDYFNRPAYLAQSPPFSRHSAKQRRPSQNKQPP